MSESENFSPDIDSAKSLNNIRIQNNDSDVSILKTMKDLIMWRKPAHSAAVLLTCLTLELSLLTFSVISVLAYSGLALLAVATSFRLYLRFSGSGSSSSDNNDLIKNYVDRDNNDRDDDHLKARSPQTSATHHLIISIDNGILKLKSLLLIDDYLESFKLAILLYLMTYIGARFNFMTLCILSTLLTFLVPKIYILYQVQIDQFGGQMKEKLVELWSKCEQTMSRLPLVGTIFRRHNE